MFPSSLYRANGIEHFLLSVQSLFPKCKSQQALSRTWSTASCDRSRVEGCALVADRWCRDPVLDLVLIGRLTGGVLQALALMRPRLLIKRAFHQVVLHLS